MKKFYAQIFIAAFLLTGFCTQAQVYNSISANPGGLTFDDPAFWVGGLRPPNPCTGCTININSSTTLPSTISIIPSTALPTATNVFTVDGPATAHHDPEGPLTVGMRFQASVPGQITGIRFWQDALMDGSHTVALYANGGGLPLATATLSDPTGFPARWRTISFATPVTITPGTTYVVATFMANGFYVFTTGDFAAPVNNGVLTGLEHNPPTDPNAVYDYTATLQFPTSFYTPGTNYWVDPVFAATPYNRNDVVFNSSSIKVFGNSDLNINTKTELFGTLLQMGNDPTSTQTLSVNDQMFLDGTSTIQLANANTIIDATNPTTPANPRIGTFIFPGTASTIIAGIYTLRPLPANTDVTLSAITNVRWDLLYSINPYPINCSIAGGTCAVGVVFGPAITQFDVANSFFGFASSTTLPVVLAQFIASKQSDGSVKLSWTTSQEVNAGYYDVERSGDQSGWTKIGSVPAKGNSSIATNYTLFDKFPLDGTGYYRLKMVDLDGKYVYSKTVSVSSDKNALPLVIYNNPFTDMIRLKVNVNRAQNLTMTVSDILGKTYIRQSIQAQAGDNLVNLQPAVIGGSGMYILRITGDSYNQTAKIEKQ